MSANPDREEAMHDEVTARLDRLESRVREAARAFDFEVWPNKLPGDHRMVDRQLILNHILHETAELRKKIMSAPAVRAAAFFGSQPASSALISVLGLEMAMWPLGYYTYAEATQFILKKKAA